MLTLVTPVAARHAAPFADPAEAALIRNAKELRDYWRTRRGTWTENQRRLWEMEVCAVLAEIVERCDG